MSHVIRRFQSTDHEEGVEMPRIRSREPVSSDEVETRYKNDPEFRHALTSRRNNRPHAVRLLVKFIRDGSLAWVQDMVLRNVPVNAKLQNLTPLFAASQVGHLAIVKLLVSKGADINLKSLDGQTPIMAAIQNKDTTMVEWLLAQGARVSVRDDQGFTCVHGAILAGDDSLLRLLLKANADPNAAGGKNQEPLVLATTMGRLDLIKLLIEAGTDLSNKSDLGYRALRQAVFDGHLEIAKFFLEFGVEVNKENERIPLVFIAARNRALPEDWKQAMECGAEIKRVVNLPILELLLKYGADPLAVVEVGDMKLSTVNMVACSSTVEAMTLFLESGVNVNEVSFPGTTPLFQACCCSRLDMAIFLLEKGADLEIEGPGGNTPISYAVWGRDVNVTRFLIEHGADVNKSDLHGTAPLAVAVSNGDAEIVRILLDAGADPNASFMSVSNVLQLAAWMGLDEIVSMLRSKGARFPEELNESEEWSLLVSEEIVNLAHRGDFAQALDLLAELNDQEARKANASIILKCAAGRKSQSVAKEIVACYPQVDCQEAFVAAASNGDKELLQLFVEKNISEDGKHTTLSCGPVLKAIAGNGSVQLFNLVAQYAQDLKTDPNLGNDLLELAGSKCHTKLLKRLLDLRYGTESGRLNSAGMWALRSGVKAENSKVIDIMLQAGSLISEILCDSSDPILVIVADRNDVRLAKRLLDRGCQVNERGRNGETALIRAAKLGHTEMVKLLIMRGADVHARDDKGRSALDHAMARKRLNLIQLLQASGA